MATIERGNERSWAIEVITQINLLLESMNIRIKHAGGEKTLSVDKKSMFPDLLLFADKKCSRVLQGWELKMPDVPITDAGLINDAIRKANALGLNSFVIWNFSWGKLYVKKADGVFSAAKEWNLSDCISKRRDVETHQDKWLQVIKDIIITVNEYISRGAIVQTLIADSISDGLLPEIIKRNKDMVAEELRDKASRSMTMEQRLVKWWKSYHEEYDKDESDMYSAYAKTVLLNWTNRILFANAIKHYHDCAYKIDKISRESTPVGANDIIGEIVACGDFYNAFTQIEFSDIIPLDAWNDIVDYNLFLVENRIEAIDQRVLQEILEKTVATSKRELRGQYATPYILADILSQITIEDWREESADLCCGTGTIAKAILDNKLKRVHSVEVGYQTLWASDKYSYPLQIANIALTSADAFKITLNVFQRDVFDVNTDDEIELRDPSNGAVFTRKIPAFRTIISNLPFVEYNKNSDDAKECMETYRGLIQENTGIEFTRGKADIYNYIPFKLHELLDNDGRVGLILSNSWLGTDIGMQFFEALSFYYQIEKVIASGMGKWFSNADVITTLLVLRKKDIFLPDKRRQVSFFRIGKELGELNEDEKAEIVNALVLEEEADTPLVTCTRFSLLQVDDFYHRGICLNACLHSIDWIDQLMDKLVPITQYLKVVRGERTGYNRMFYLSDPGRIHRDFIVPMLKSTQNVKGYIAEPDMFAFCCTKTIEELQTDEYKGTLDWIRQYSDEFFNPIPQSINYNPWYMMPNTNRADIVTSENPDKRLFFAKMNEGVLVDQRLIAMRYLDAGISTDLVFALLNSIYGMFSIEANGFPRGLGVLDISTTRFEKTYMIDPSLFSERQAEIIISLFEKVMNRGIKNVADDLDDPCRTEFDKTILSYLGCEHLYERIKESILSMQKTRQSVRR